MIFSYIIYKYVKKQYGNLVKYVNLLISKQRHFLISLCQYCWQTLREKRDFFCLYFNIIRNKLDSRALPGKMLDLGLLK